MGQQKLHRNMLHLHLSNQHTSPNSQLIIHQNLLTILPRLNIKKSKSQAMDHQHRLHQNTSPIRHLPSMKNQSHQRSHRILQSNKHTSHLLSNQLTILLNNNHTILPNSKHIIHLSNQHTSPNSQLTIHLSNQHISLNSQLTIHLSNSSNLTSSLPSNKLTIHPGNKLIILPSHQHISLLHQSNHHISHLKQHMHLQSNQLVLLPINHQDSIHPNSNMDPPPLLLS